MVVRNEHDHTPNPATTQVAIAGMRKRARDESIGSRMKKATLT